MTLQMFGPRMQQLQSVSSQLGWLCCTTVCTIILPATLSTARAEHRWEGLERATLALKWKVGYNVRLKGQGLFPSFPVSFNISSTSRPFSCALLISQSAQLQNLNIFFIFGFVGGELIFLYIKNMISLTLGGCRRGLPTAGWRQGQGGAEYPCQGVLPRCQLHLMCD